MAKKSPDRANGYQTSFLSRLEPDVPLDESIVMLGDPRWKECLREFRAARWFSLDTEFYEAGRGAFRSARDIDYWKAAVRLIQVGLPSGRVIVADLGGMFDDRDRCREAHLPFLSVLKSRGEDPAVPVYGMALLTEYLLLRIGFGIALRGLRDIMLASQVVWAGVASKGKRWTRGGLRMEQRLKHKLGFICDRLGVEMDKTEQASDWAGRLTNRQLNYAGRDPVAPVECWRKIRDIIKYDGLEKSVRAELDAQAAFCECEFQGLPYDGPRLLRDLEDWAIVRDHFWADFRKRFPTVNPRSPQEVARAFQDALDVRRCGTCGLDFDPLAHREPADWRPPGAFAVIDPPKAEDGARGWRLAKPPGRCPGCGGPPEGFSPVGERVFYEEGRDKRGRTTIATKTSDGEMAPYKDVLLVRSLLEGKSVATCRNWLEAVAEHGKMGRIRADFQQIAGGFQEHGETAEGDAGKGMGRSSASRPINTQNPSNLQDLHADAGEQVIGRKTPSVREPIRAPDADLPRRLREAADALERGTFYRTRAPLPQDHVRAAEFRKEADALEARGIRAGGRSRSFGVADLSQAHARIAAEASQDPVMLRDFRAGRDFHLAMSHRLCAVEDPGFTFEEAERAYKDKAHPWHKRVKARRKTAKPANYGGFNLQGPRTLQVTAAKAADPVVEPIEVWERVREAWVDLYRVFARFQRATIKKANRCRHRFDHIGVDGEYGEVRALTGRRLFLVKEWSPRFEGYSVKGTDCVSAVWMMTEADVIKYAMGNILRDFDAHPEWGAIFTNMAHDEIDFECWEEHAAAVAEAVQRRFHEAMRWGGVVSVPVDEPGAEGRSSSLIKESWASK